MTTKKIIKEYSQTFTDLAKHDSTQALLQERGKTHGDFTCNARVSQELKTTLHCENAELSDVQREAIDMICHKLARVVCGNPNEKDHFDDIAGYAKLVSDRL